MQIPTLLVRLYHFAIQRLVWRLSEFAFLCAYYGRRTFYFVQKINADGLKREREWL